jgi:hypothetical protein
MISTSDISPISVCATPLTYLTFLFKAHVKDAASVRWYIRRPLEQVLYQAWQCVDRGHSSNPELWSIYQARAQRSFTEGLHQSAASPQLKRDMSSLPLEHLFDAFVQYMLVHPLREHHYTWIIKCATHADVGADGSLKDQLDQYDFTRMIQGDDPDHDVPVEKLFDSDGLISTRLTEITRVMREVATSDPEDIAPVLR